MGNHIRQKQLNDQNNNSTLRVSFYRSEGDF